VERPRRPRPRPPRRAHPPSPAREPDPFVQRALGTLTERERCVAIRAGIEDVAVPKAFELCGWKTPSPYAEYNKILRKLKVELEGTDA